MTRRKTDGERVANATEGLGLVGKHYLAERIDRLIRRRMAEAWEEGYESAFVWGSAKANPYRGRRKK
jgi:hypothetical protein